MKLKQSCPNVLMLTEEEEEEEEEVKFSQLKLINF
jgi:hypothetical protein